MTEKKTISASTTPMIAGVKTKKTAVKKATKSTRQQSVKSAAKKAAKKEKPENKQINKAQRDKAVTAKKAKSPLKNPAQPLIDGVVEGILEVKGKNISILDLRNIHNRVCDYYILCQADSTTQVNAIAGSVEEIVRKRTGEKPYHSEGFQNAEWILIDYVTIVVHVFQSHIREFYNLETLWADAEISRIASE